MDYMDKIVSTLILIKNICNDRSCKIDCPFYDVREGHCAFLLGTIPGAWNINETPIWRAFK